MEHRIILFYKYVPISEPERLMERERAVCEVLNLTGRMIIANEGINATLEGTGDAIKAYCQHLKKDRRFKRLDIKETEGTGNAFPRLSIKVRSEIVTTNLGPEIDPRKDTGKHLPPRDLKRWFAEGSEFYIIDMRNDYEYDAGHFRGAHKSGMENFKELHGVAKKYENLKQKKVLTVCTGGVRCEKGSAYLKSQGFTDVYQLEGGIHRYMEEFPGEDFLGTLYTFDGRVTMHFGGDREVVGRCTHCDTLSESYADCGVETCGAHFISCDLCRTLDGIAYCQEHRLTPNELIHSRVT